MVSRNHYIDGGHDYRVTLISTCCVRSTIFLEIAVISLASGILESHLIFQNVAEKIDYEKV
jgi:hypothetical protein